MTEKWAIDKTAIKKYIESCNDFVKNDDLFDTFKQDSRYTAILEHVGKEESDILISEMKSKGLITPDILNSIKENDTYGSPTTFNYNEFGNISPSSIRYTKNCLDILSHFGDKIKYKKVLEIGGGYGGLCKVFSSFVNFSNYYLVDLPEVSELSKKYLNKFDSIKNKVVYMNTENVIKVDKLDLVISNYAFSECSKECQQNYYDLMIKNSKSFYMVYNNFTVGNLNSESFIEIASKDFDIKIEDEIRSTHSNCILYGIKK